MKNKCTFLILLLALIFLYGSFEQVSACSCVGINSCQAYNSADVVFVGKVIGAKQQKTVEDYSGNFENSNTSTPAKPRTITYDVGEIYFEVQESFDGIEKGSKITIFSGTGGGDCGAWFKRGETYLVYAYRENPASTQPVSSLTLSNSNETEQLKPDANRLWTSICSRTASVKEAKEDLDYLRTLSAQAQGKVFGQISQKFYFEKDNEIKPFADLLLNFRNLDGEGKVFSTKTNSNGKFEINVPRGKYSIIPSLPDYAILPEVEEDAIDTKIFQVKANGCYQVDLTAESKSKISGKLISSDGKPLNGIDVEVIDFYTKDWVTDAESKADGSFSIEAIPAGKYILAINKNISPSAESPFPTYFYPKSSVQSRALTLTIDLGKSIENLIFQLPPKLEEQEISGTVFWADGRPAADTRVEIDDTNDDSISRGERITKTDASGKFKLKGFVGRSYILQAKFEKYEKLSEEEARKEMELTNKISIVVSGDTREYVRITRGTAKIKPFKILNKPIVFKIVLKEE